MQLTSLLSIATRGLRKYFKPMPLIASATLPSTRESRTSALSGQTSLTGPLAHRFSITLSTRQAPTSSRSTTSSRLSTIPASHSFRNTPQHQIIYNQYHQYHSQARLAWPVLARRFSNKKSEWASAALYYSGHHVKSNLRYFHICRHY
jgi:hypothetical protein